MGIATAAFEQLCLFVVHERVLLEPFRPVQEVSVVGAGVSAYLRVLLTLRFRMVSDVDRYLVSRFILDIFPNLVCVPKGMRYFLLAHVLLFSGCRAFPHRVSCRRV